MTVKKRVIYRVNISPTGKWSGKRKNSVWNINQDFFEDALKNIFTPRLERYAASVGADLITINKFDYDALKIERRTWFYRAANCMKFYALKDAYQRGYEDFLLVDNDIFISQKSEDIFKETKKNSFYMKPTNKLNMGLVDVAKRHYNFDLTQTWNGGVILARGKALESLVKSMPLSMYDFFERITWSKGYSFKVGKKALHNSCPEGYAASDEIVFPFLALKSKIKLEALGSEWNRLVGLKKPNAIWKNAKNANFLHFASRSKKLLTNEFFLKKLLLKF